MRPAFLFEAAGCAGSTTRSCSPTPRWRALDPALDSLLNLNEPADYEAARARPAPMTVERFGVLAGNGRGDPAPSRAATLGEAAAPPASRSTRTWSPRSTATRSRATPRCRWSRGDTVAFLSADAGG